MPFVFRVTPVSSSDDAARRRRTVWSLANGRMAICEGIMWPGLPRLGMSGKRADRKGRWGLTGRRFPCSVSTMESQSALVAGKQVRGTPAMACCWFWFSFAYYQPPGGAGGA